MRIFLLILCISFSAPAKKIDILIFNLSSKELIFLPSITSQAYKVFLVDGLLLLNVEEGKPYNLLFMHKMGSRLIPGIYRIPSPVYAQVYTILPEDL